MEYHVCTECAERSKRSFMGSRILWKHEAEPVLEAKTKEKELPPTPVQVPPVVAAPVATMSHIMERINSTPKVRLPGMPKMESPMQGVINRGSASMAEIAQRCIPLKDIGTKLRFTPRTKKLRSWVPIKVREGTEL
jgi:hypothetical protein